MISGKKIRLFQQAQLLHNVKKVHFGLAHLHLLNLINVYTTFSPAAYCIHFAGQLQAL